MSDRDNNGRDVAKGLSQGRGGGRGVESVFRYYKGKERKGKEKKREEMS